MKSVSRLIGQEGIDFVELLRVGVEVVHQDD